VSDAYVPLESAGLEFTPGNGLFQVQITNSQSSTTQTVDIRVDLNGVGADTTLANLAAQLDAVDGITAQVTADGELQITSDAPEITFAFAHDTSGALAALGLNTFFTGTGSKTIGISQVLRDDARKLAMSSGGVAADTQNGLALANLLTAPLASRDGASLAALYDRITNDVAQSAQTARAATDGFRTFQQALDAQHQAITGVNLDEEAVRMITLQRAFQAAARVISTVDEMLEILVNL
jgi:flagellar hook-associated protein 1 FlgK